MRLRLRRRILVRTRPRSQRLTRIVLLLGRRPQQGLRGRRLGGGRGLGGGGGGGGLLGWVCDFCHTRQRGRGRGFGGGGEWGSFLEHERGRYSIRYHERERGCVC